MCAVELRKAGLRVTGTPLWLDARRKTELSFVSHAHADHLAPHDRVIATSATIRMMAHRLKRTPGALPAPYNRPFELGPLLLELLPAGHMLGSAQLRVVRQDGTRIAYTGDLNTVASLTAEPVQIAECDTLVVESTFGHPRFRFPPKDEVLGQLEGWIRTQLDRQVRPILLGYPFGKSQEAIKHLLARGLKVAAHPKVFAVSRLYGELGVELDGVRRFDGVLHDGEVGIFPPFAKDAYQALTPRSVAVLTGWAVEEWGARRYGADVAFPLSDHADFPALLQYVKATGATEVLTHHGFARELAEALRAEGIDARAAGTRQQLELFPTGVQTVGPLEV